MKIILPFLFLLFSFNVFSLDYKNDSNGNIFISGSILVGDSSTFISKWQTATKNIHVKDIKSGDQIEALKIMNFLADKEYEATIDGACHSACAEAFALMAYKRTFNGSYIAFAGNLQSVTKDLRHLIKVDGGKTTPTANEKKEWAQMSNLEKKILKSKVINNDLFGETNFINKGYMYVPSLMRLEEYGLKNNTGTIDVSEMILSGHNFYYK